MELLGPNYENTKGLYTIPHWKCGVRTQRILTSRENIVVSFGRVLRLLHSEEERTTATNDCFVQGEDIILFCLVLRLGRNKGEINCSHLKHYTYALYEWCNLSAFWFKFRVMLSNKKGHKKTWKWAIFILSTRILVTPANTWIVNGVPLRTYIWQVHTVSLLPSARRGTKEIPKMMSNLLLRQHL